MKTVCIIPARGGSKRIPRKNVRSLHGRPLVAWTIAVAQRSGLFDEIMVSTDDYEIAAHALAAGAAVPFLRSAQLSDDHAPTAAVMREVLDAYAASGEDAFTTVCCLYATSALLQPERLREGLRRLADDPSLDSVLSVQAYGHPIERAYRLRDGLIAPADPAKQLVRTQDFEPAFHDAGQFYFFRANGLRARGWMVGPRSAPVMLSAWEAIDLDTEADWQLLECLMPIPELA